jgi:hypothetical protein
LIQCVDVPFNQAKRPDLDHRPGPLRLIRGGNVAGEMSYWLQMPAMDLMIAKRCQEDGRVASVRHAASLRRCSCGIDAAAGDERNVNDLIWLLEQNATTTDAPWIVAACKTQWQLVPLANRLDAGATAVALAEEWRSHAAKNFIPPDLIHAIVNVRVRPMFAPVIEQIAGKWVNHHMVVFLMDPVVGGEKSDALETAFRGALGACLRLKLEQNDRYELPRISRIALRHGVPEAVAATVVCESGSPEQLRKVLAPFLELPADDRAALAYLRTNDSRWQWESVTRKFTAPTQGER